MGSKSNAQGRAYEFAYLIALFEEISKFRKVQIEKNDSYYICEKFWNKLNDFEKREYKNSALSGIYTLFSLEPLILEDDNDILQILIQQDLQGQKGDVRDILIIRNKIKWEIGLSIKHNHFAVKHSRLSKNIDFGERWYGIKCSNEYWNEVNNIFEHLEVEKTKGIRWNELHNKEDKVYVPLLKAFKNEINRQKSKFEKTISKNIVEYFIGKFDFYKSIAMDNKKITQLQSYNLHGTLNKNSSKVKQIIKIPLVNLPTRIISLDFKSNSSTTLELYLNEGWQFSLRIHSASTFVEPSLKFDIQLIGIPATIMFIDCKWK